MSIKHYATVSITRRDFERINRLLRTEFISMDDEERSQAGFVKDYYEGIYEAVFDDNSRITWDLASGNSNYYDNAVWQNADGTRSVIPDCEYQLNDITIRVHNGFKITDEYFVKIVIEEE